MIDLEPWAVAACILAGGKDRVVVEGVLGTSAPAVRQPSIPALVHLGAGGLASALVEAGLVGQEPSSIEVAVAAEPG